MPRLEACLVDAYDTIVTCDFSPLRQGVPALAGIPVAAIISPDDWERFQRFEAEWDAPFAALDRTRDAFKDVPEEELERQVRQGVTEARAQLRAERERAGTTS